MQFKHLLWTTTVYIKRGKLTARLVIFYNVAVFAIIRAANSWLRRAKNRFHMHGEVAMCVWPRILRYCIVNVVTTWHGFLCWAKTTVILTPCRRRVGMFYDRRITFQCSAWMRSSPRCLRKISKTLIVWEIRFRFLSGDTQSSPSLTFLSFALTVSSLSQDTWEMRKQSGERNTSADAEFVSLMVVLCDDAYASNLNTMNYLYYLLAFYLSYLLDLAFCF